MSATAGVPQCKVVEEALGLGRSGVLLMPLWWGGWHAVCMALKFPDDLWSMRLAVSVGGGVRVVVGVSVDVLMMSDDTFLVSGSVSFVAVVAAGLSL